MGERHNGREEEDEQEVISRKAQVESTAEERKGTRSWGRPGEYMDELPGWGEGVCNGKRPVE